MKKKDFSDKWKTTDNLSQKQDKVIFAKEEEKGGGLYDFFKNKRKKTIPSEEEPIVTMGKKALPTIEGGFSPEKKPTKLPAKQGPDDLKKKRRRTILILVSVICLVLLMIILLIAFLYPSKEKPIIINEPEIQEPAATIPPTKTTPPALTNVSKQIITFILGGGRGGGGAGPEPPTPISYPLVNFVAPTPDDDTMIVEDNILINTSIVLGDYELSQVKFAWDETEHIMYDDSLVLMYNFDKVSALGETDTHVADLSKYENNGDVKDYNSSNDDGNSPAIWTSNGKYNGAFEFDGIDDYVDLGEEAIVNQSTQFTISGWIKGTLGTMFSEQSITYKSVTLSLRINQTGEGVFGIYNETDWQRIYGNKLINDSSWHYITGTFSTTNGMKLYVDGVLDGSNPTATVVQYESSFPVIGAFWGNTATAPLGMYNFFNGSIDEVRIWSRSLSEEEVKQNYISNLYKYDVGKWIMYIEQSDLITGTYEYSASMKSMRGEDTTETRTATIGAPLPSPPKENIFSKIINFFKDLF